MKKRKDDKLIGLRCLEVSLPSSALRCYPGTLVEVSEKDLNTYKLESKRRRLLSKVEQKRLGPNWLSVRAPVVAPFQNVGYYPGWKQEDNFSNLELGPKDFLQTGEMPVSQYERKPLCSSEDLLDKIVSRRCTEGFYISTHSKKDLTKGVISKYLDSLPHHFIWKKERDDKIKSCFLEARIYPIDILISPCPKHVKGFVLCVYSRGISNYFSERMVEDVYVVSSDTDYVDYLDGSELNKEKTTKVFISRYLKDISISQCLALMKKGKLSQQTKKEEK